GLDQAGHLVAGRPGDQRPHVGGGVEAGGGAQPPRPLHDPVDQGVAGPADGHGGGDGHAALAGGAVGGRDQRVGGRVHVGVGHDDGVGLGPAEGLDPLAGVGGVADVGVGDDDGVFLVPAEGRDPLAVGGAALVDVAGDRGRADEGDGG